MDCINREEYQKAMDRLHQRIDNISSDVAAIKVASEFIMKSADKIHEAVFGNGKPGALQRITQMWTKITVQWWLIGTLFGCVGVITTIFINHLSLK
jgi:hypothetical protein